MITRIQRGQRGSINILLIPFILIVLFFIGAVVFAYSAYSKGQDYKTNFNQKAAVLVGQAVKVEDTKKDTQFAEDAKQPLKTYAGPDTFGSIKLSYPKTWSGYVDDTTNGSAAVDGYFSPGVVPALQGQASVFALRVQVLNQSYSSVMQTYTNLLTAKKVTVAPYSLPKVSSVVGSRVDGEISTNKQGSLVVLPLRDKTLKIWTEATQFKSDLDTSILPNFTFSP
jgi:hypothetical protein